MKKIVLTVSVAITMLSCNSVKNVDTSTIAQASTLLSSLSSNSTVQQITSLFNLLDTDHNDAISSSEAIGSVSENFDVLDTDNSSNLNLTELTGLLDLLK